MVIPQHLVSAALHLEVGFRGGLCQSGIVILLARRAHWRDLPVWNDRALLKHCNLLSEVGQVSELRELENDLVV